MSLDRVREALGLGRALSMIYDDDKDCEEFKQALSDLTTHEKEDKERNRALETAESAHERWSKKWIEDTNALEDERDSLRTQLQELLEAAKWVVEESGDRAIRANPAKSPLARLRQVIQNIEGIKVDRTG